MAKYNVYKGSMEEAVPGTTSNIPLNKYNTTIKRN